MAPLLLGLRRIGPDKSTGPHAQQAQPAIERDAAQTFPGGTADAQRVGFLRKAPELANIYQLDLLNAALRERKLPEVK